MKVQLSIASVVTLAAVLFTGAAQASPLSLGAATGFNVFTLSDFSESGTDAAGKVAVGGNFAPAGGGSFTLASAHGGDGAGVYDVVVAGNFTNLNTQMGGGDIFVGGNMNWTTPTVGHNIYVDGTFTSTGGGSVGKVYYTGGYNGPAYFSNQFESSKADPIDFLAAKTNLQSVSSALATQAATGTVAFDGFSTYTLTGPNTGSLAVFDMTASSYASKTINVNVTAGSTVVINVPGTSDSFTGGSVSINGVPSNDVIFNFSAATSLSVSSYSVNGTILAPYAAFTGDSHSNINGQLIANTATGGTEMHEYSFSGTLPAASSGVAATPEPATWATFLIGGLLIGIARRKVTSRD